MWFSCFRVLPDSAEAQVIWGGVVKRRLIAYFIGNISAKKCQNPFMCVKVIASQRWDVFWDTVHMVWSFSANLECRSEMCCTRLTGNTGRKTTQKSPSGHHRTTSSVWIFATKACIDNRKNLLSSNMSSTGPHNMANFGPVAAEIGSEVWGTPANFNRFRVLAALLRATLVVGVSQTLRRWTDGATYIRQGGHHVVHWSTF